MTDTQETAQNDSQNETGIDTTPTVLITGSTSGIGAACARRLAAEGWLVVVTGRDLGRGEAVVAEIEQADGRAVFVPSDLTASPDELRTFAQAAGEAAGGHLDAVVHNAAVCPAVDTLSLSDTDLETALAVNVRAPHLLTAALAPAMLDRRRGWIVVVGSWMAQIGHPFVGLYSATKAAEAQLAPQLGRRVRSGWNQGQHRLAGCHSNAHQCRRRRCHRRDDRRHRGRSPRDARRGRCRGGVADVG